MPGGENKQRHFCLLTSEFFPEALQSPTSASRSFNPAVNQWTEQLAAAAKSLQLCPTLWDPIDSSPPGSPWETQFAGVNSMHTEESRERAGGEWKCKQ